MRLMSSSTTGKSGSSSATEADNAATKTKEVEGSDTKQELGIFFYQFLVG